jgi:hypothetical protein
MWRNVEIIPDKEEKPPQLRGRITESRCRHQSSNPLFFERLDKDIFVLSYLFDKKV